MFTPGVRFLLVAVATLLGWYGVTHGRPVGWALVAAALPLVWGYVRANTIWLAFAAYRRGDFVRVRELLAHVTLPQLLSARNRAYYEWLSGVVLAVDHRYEEARARLRRAQAGELRTPNVRAIIECQLAEIALENGEADLAREHVARVRVLHPAQRLEGSADVLESRLSRGGRPRTGHTRTDLGHVGSSHSDSSHASPPP